MTEDRFSNFEPTASPLGGAATNGEAPKAGERVIAPVPTNTLGTKDPLLLQMTEDVAATARAWEVMVGDVRLPGKFDGDHLRAIHAHVMQDTYPETGTTRGDERLIAEKDVKANPGKEMPIEYDSRIGTNGESITLLGAGKVNERLETLSRHLQSENELRGLDKPAFINKLADYYLQYSQAAPFTAGNEHVLGVVANQIGFRAGYHVDIISAQHLREATDATLAAGITSDKSQLVQVLSGVVREAGGIGPKAARSPTLSALPLEVSPNFKKQQTQEDLTQAGTKLIGKVGGQEAERFKASMRALIAGDSAPEHINVVRTTALKHGGPELANETKRIEQGAAWLDSYRRGEQQQDRQSAQSGVSPRESGRAVPSEITR